MVSVCDLFSIIKKKIKTEEELKNIVNELKFKANNFDLSNLNNYSYDECKYLYKHINCYIDSDDLLSGLRDIVKEKKITKYPELLKPTYYPEIDLLDISDSEKLRLDMAVRSNYKYHLNKYNIKGLDIPLSIDDLELLKSIGIVEKGYDFKCKICGNPCERIPESDLEKYKRYWKLSELEKQKLITDEQLEELDQLDKDGFYEIFLCCTNSYKCDEIEIEITNEKELDDYVKRADVYYQIIKSPDLTYEKL